MIIYKILDIMNLNDNGLVCSVQMSHRNKVGFWYLGLCLVKMALSYHLTQEPSTYLERYFCM